MQTQDPSPENVDYIGELTGEIPPSSASKTEEAGVRIKKIRESKGASLEYVARMTGVEMDLLAKIEACEIKPQLGTLAKLSKALDSAFPRVVSGVGEKSYAITRKNEGKVTVRATSQKGDREVYRYFSLSSDVKERHMEPLIVELNENPDKEVSFHDGEEFIYVLEGVVLCKIGEDEFDLNPGDTVYYVSTTPHALSAKSGKAKILAVIYE